MPILAARNIHKSYYLKNETINVLKGIDLMVEKGTFVIIVGPSGSGKSTLLNIIGSLDKPTQGEVILDSIALFSHNANALAKLRNKKIGFIFQFHHLLPEFTALENIALPGMVNGKDAAETYRRARNILQVLGLEDKENRLPEEMSGGERQRVAIGRALINEPSVILADEPTGNLDDENTDKLMKVLVGLRDDGRTIILVTHSLDIAKLGTDVYNLKEGKLYAMR